ncbi:MAG: hypothetical protein O4859_02450 [Trichodesmium sp. St18_bin1]|nr:hypothetical protein [Trichodesmium sp. St18_bin1]MDE5120656.1 hypothetical protein [Trichodesmium sp. St19_bin1]
MPTEIPGLPKVLMPLIFFVFYRINLFNLLAQNSNDNSCIFLYYMPEVPNVGWNETEKLSGKIIN